MEENNKDAKNTPQEEVFSLKDFFASCLRQWKWFLLSIVFFCGIGVFYILRQQPVYSRSMSILIKDQKRGGTADISSAFSSMGLVASNTKVNNELISLTSPAIMADVVKQLDLEMNYASPGMFHNVTLYGKTQPVVVNFADLDEQQGASMSLRLDGKGGFELTKFRTRTETEKIKSDEVVKGKLGVPVKTPLGSVLVTPNDRYQSSFRNVKNSPKEILVWRTGMQSAIESYSAKLHGDMADKDADVIDLSIKDVSTERAVDILNTVVEVYNRNWVDDKNKISVATSHFIDERLAILEQELGNVDSDIYGYKQKNATPDIWTSAKVNIEAAAELDRNILALTNQLTMAAYMKEYLSNPANSDKVIPMNTGAANAQIESQVSAYNNLLLQRNNLVQNSSEKNPIVADMDARLAGMRESITRGVDNEVVSIQAALRNSKGARGIAKSELSSTPSQAKHLIGYERKQTVMQSLYIFLLQKREENELSQTFTAANTRIITPPTGKLSPVSPNKKMILVVTFLLGLCVPGAALYLAEASNTKIRSRKDLERMAAPFAGEIPYVGHNTLKTKLGKFLGGNRKKSSRQLEKVVPAVKEGSRDAISESFRILRGNIDFMIAQDKDKSSNIIMLTSFNPGSGKSFISFNLSASFALKGKSVLVIDGDLRHGSMSQFVGMPSRGLSNYLTGNTDDWQGLVKSVADHPGMFVLPIGHRPPNPSELLDNGRIGTLLNEAREAYDYVFVDCPPVDVVVDTRIVEKYVDRTVFVVRAGLLDRKDVAEIDALYQNRSFKQMCIVLNGTDGRNSRSQAYGRGYYGN